MTSQVALTPQPTLSNNQRLADSMHQVVERFRYQLLAMGGPGSHWVSVELESVALHVVCMLNKCLYDHPFVCSIPAKTQQCKPAVVS